MKVATYGSLGESHEKTALINAGSSSSRMSFDQPNKEEEGNEEYNIESNEPQMVRVGFWIDDEREMLVTGSSSSLSESTKERKKKQPAVLVIPPILEDKYVSNAIGLSQMSFEWQPRLIVPSALFTAVCVASVIAHVVLEQQRDGFLYLSWVDALPIIGLTVWMAVNTVRLFRQERHSETKDKKGISKVWSGKSLYKLFVPIHERKLTFFHENASSGHQLISLLICAFLIATVFILAPLAFKRCIEYSEAAGANNTECWTAALQPGSKLNNISLKCDACVVSLVFANNTAFYLFLGSLLAFTVALSVVPRKGCQQLFYELIKELDQKSAAASYMAKKAERDARQIAVHRSKLTRFIFFIITPLSIAAFIGTMIGSIFYTSVSSIENKPLVINEMYVAVAVLDILIIILAAWPLIHLLIVELSLVMDYCMLQVVAFSSYIDPEANRQFSSASQPKHESNSEQEDNANARKYIMFAKENLSNLSSKNDPIDSVRKFFNSARLYLLAWADARSFQCVNAINFEITNIGGVLVTLIIVSLVCFIITIIQLASQSFRADVLLLPSNALLVFVGVYALITVLLTGLKLMKMLDNTDYQLLLIHKHAYQCRGRADLYRIPDDLISSPPIVQEYKVFDGFLEQLRERLETFDDRPKIIGVGIRRSYQTLLYSYALAHVGTLIAFVVTNLESFINSNSE